MDIPNSHHQVLSFFTLLLLFFLYSTSSTEAAPSNLVEYVCKETIDYAKCIKALESDPRAKSAENLNALANITLELAIDNAKDSLAFIKKLLEKNISCSSDIRLALKQCVTSYKTAIASFKSALSELSEDPMTANYDIKTTTDDANSCENEMASRKIRIPSVSKKNNQVKLYSSIGDVITNKL